MAPSAKGGQRWSSLWACKMTFTESPAHCNFGYEDMAAHTHKHVYGCQWMPYAGRSRAEFPPELALSAVRKT